MGRVIDLGVKLIDANEVRGIKAQPLNIWGHEAIRKSYVVGDSTLTTTYLSTTLSLTAADRKYPVAPKQANADMSNTVAVPVYGTDGQTIVGFKEIAKAVSPNGGNMQSGLPHVADPTASVAPGTYSSTQSVTLSTTTSGADIYYTTNGTMPTLASTKYSSPISVSATQTINAIAVATGMVPSDVVSFAYTISAD